MGHVFLSHAGSDVRMAKRAADALAADGFEVWWDDQVPTHRKFHEVINEHLRAADAVLVLWSRAAAQSDWVRSEADFARKQSRLIQASLDGDLPPMPFDQIQCAKLLGWKGETDHSGWRKVVESVRTVVGGAVRSDVSAPQRRRWSRLIAFAIVVVVAIGVGSYFWTRTPQSSPQTTVERSFTPRVAVLPFETIGESGEATGFAAELADKVAGSLSENIVQTLPVSRTAEFSGGDRSTRLKALGVNLALAGSVRVSDGRLFVRAYFEDLESGFTIWSAKFERSAD